MVYMKTEQTFCDQHDTLNQILLLILSSWLYRSGVYLPALGKLKADVYSKHSGRLSEQHFAFLDGH